MIPPENKPLDERRARERQSRRKDVTREIAPSRWTGRIDRTRDGVCIDTGKDFLSSTSRYAKSMFPLLQSSSEAVSRDIQLPTLVPSSIERRARDMRRKDVTREIAPSRWTGRIDRTRDGVCIDTGKGEFKKDSHVSRLRADGHGYRRTRRQRNGDGQYDQSFKLPVDVKVVEEAKLKQIMGDFGQSTYALNPNQKLPAIKTPAADRNVSIAKENWDVANFHKKKESMSLSPDRHGYARTQSKKYDLPVCAADNKKEDVRTMQQNARMDTNVAATGQRAAISLTSSSGLSSKLMSTMTTEVSQESIQNSASRVINECGPKQESRRRWKPVLIAVRHTKKSSQMQMNAQAKADTSKFKDEASRFPKEQFRSEDGTTLSTGDKSTIAKSTKFVKRETSNVSGAVSASSKPVVSTSVVTSYVASTRSASSHASSAKSALSTSSVGRNTPSGMAVRNHAISPMSVEACTFIASNEAISSKSERRRAQSDRSVGSNTSHTSNAEIGRSASCRSPSVKSVGSTTSHTSNAEIARSASCRSPSVKSVGSTTSHTSNAEIARSTSCRSPSVKSVGSTTSHASHADSIKSTISRHPSGKYVGSTTSHASHTESAKSTIRRPPSSKSVGSISSHASHAESATSPLSRPPSGKSVGSITAHANRAESAKSTISRPPTGKSVGSISSHASHAESAKSTVSRPPSGKSVGSITAHASRAESAKSTVSRPPTSKSVGSTSSHARHAESAKYTISRPPSGKSLGSTTYHASHAESVKSTISRPPSVRSVGSISSHASHVESVKSARRMPPSGKSVGSTTSHFSHDESAKSTISRPPSGKSVGSISSHVSHAESVKSARRMPPSGKSVGSTTSHVSHAESSKSGRSSALPEKAAYSNTYLAGNATPARSTKRSYSSIKYSTSVRGSAASIRSMQSASSTNSRMSCPHGAGLE